MINDEEYEDIEDEMSAAIYLEENYQEKANAISKQWDEFGDKLRHYQEAPVKMSDQEAWNSYMAELNGTDSGKNEAFLLQQEGLMYEMLATIPYGAYRTEDGETMVQEVPYDEDSYNEDMDTDGDGYNSLLDLFLLSSSDGDISIEELYPVAASLSDGQQYIASQMGFQPIFAASGEKYGEDAATIESEKAVVDNIEKAKDAIDTSVTELIDSFQEENSKIAEDVIQEDSNAISVYAGIDRSFYNGGVAVTERAYKQHNGGKEMTEDSLNPVDSNLWNFIGGAAVGLGAFFFLGGVMSILIDGEEKTNPNWFMVELRAPGEKIYKIDADNNLLCLKGSQEQLPADSIAYTAGYIMMAVGIVLLVIGIVSFILGQVTKEEEIKYLDIPLKIADISAGETGMEPYLFYNAVQNQNNKAMDLYRWKKDNWLAMYYTKSVDAGNPILTKDFCKRVGASEGVDVAVYTGIHEFATTGTSTIANGNDGFKYYFRHATAADMAASVFSDTGMLMSMLCLVFGAFGGFFVGNARKRKEEVAL